MFAQEALRIFKAQIVFEQQYAIKADKMIQHAHYRQNRDNLYHVAVELPDDVTELESEFVRDEIAKAMHRRVNPDMFKRKSIPMHKYS